MSYGSDALNMTEETFAMFKAATSGINVTTGIAGIDMIPDIMSWVSADVPFFDSVGRGPGKGATAVIYQTLLNLNGRQTRKAVKAGRAAPIVKVQNQWTYSPYQKIAAGGHVNWTAIAQGEDQADVLAVDTLQTVVQQLINLDIHGLNAVSFELPEIGAVTLVAHSTGGSIGTKTVYVKCAARSNYNWYVGGSGVASAPNHVTVTGTSGRVTASVASVKMAAGYDWYVSTDDGTYYYYTTTVVPSVTIVKVPTETQKVPTGFAGLVGSYGPTTPITGPSSVPTEDTSYTATCINGLMASILGDWASSPDQALVGSGGYKLVTPGTGVSQGAYYANLTGAQLVVSGAAFTQVDEANRKVYDTYQVSVSRMLMGSQVITDFANAFLDNPQAVTWLSPDAKNGKTEALMGGHVANYANKTADGKPIPMHLMPNLPPGQIVGVIDSLPFPGSNVTAALQARTQYDFFRFDFGASRELTEATGGPRYDFEVGSRQAFVNKASGICWVMQGIGAGIA